MGRVSIFLLLILLLSVGFVSSVDYDAHPYYDQYPCDHVEIVLKSGDRYFDHSLVPGVDMTNVPVIVDDGRYSFSVGLWSSDEFTISKTNEITDEYTHFNHRFVDGEKLFHEGLVIEILMYDYDNNHQAARLCLWEADNCSECIVDDPDPVFACIDSDLSLGYPEAYYTKGEVYRTEDGQKQGGVDRDSCSSLTSVKEVVCKLDTYFADMIDYVEYKCPNGCSAGACKKPIVYDGESSEEEKESSQESLSDEEITRLNEEWQQEQESKEVGVSQEEIIEENIEDSCINGCLIENSCVQIGYRTDNTFCDLKNSFSEQRQGTEFCNNNFECSSNLCVDSECTEEGLWIKIIKLLSRTFWKK